MSDISIIVRKMRTFAERNMAHRGIGFPEQLVLMSLLANGESNQESIAAEHGIDRGAIAKTLAKLEAKGLVARKVNSKNKREKIVCATPEATSVFNEMRASFVELDNTVEGFVPAAQLCKGEPQVIDGVSMLDPLTGKSWMLGSSMKIQVAAADVALGRIDFEYMVE